MVMLYSSASYQQTKKDGWAKSTLIEEETTQGYRFPNNKNLSSLKLAAKFHSGLKIVRLAEGPHSQLLLF